VLRTRLGTLYTGITTDVARRLQQHGGARGARALRAKAPLSLVYAVAVGERGEALRLEHAFKQLTRPTKEQLLATDPTLPALRAALGKPKATG